MRNLLRRATEADIPALKIIRAAVRENILSDPSKVTDSDYRWFIANGPIWVWDDDGIKGLSAGDPRDGSIWTLFVDPAFEGQGIGRHLIAAACTSLQEAGYTQYSLSTDTNTRAEMFYQKNGWIKGDLRPNGEVIFTKIL